MKVILFTIIFNYTLFASEFKNDLQYESSPYLLQHVSNPINWTPWGDNAFEKAKKENKALMLVVVQDPCPYCGKLVENTLSDPEVEKALEGYVGLILDKKAKMPSQFHTSMVPMTFFINPKTEEAVWESLGYAKKPRFLDDIETANLEMKK